MPRVYLPDASAGDEVILTPAQSHHLAHVLRLKSGASLLAFDGAGNEFSARLTGRGNRATVAIGELRRHEARPALAITLAPCVSRASRMDWMLEKAVELGVSAIRPVYSERGKVRLNPVRAARRLEHWQAVVTAAATQCGRAHLPPVAEPVTLTEALRTTTVANRIVLLPDAPRPLASLSAPRGTLALLIGPESGFSPRESDAIIAAGWQAAHLGPRVLRTETAGPAALAATQALWGDWRA